VNYGGEKGVDESSRLGVRGEVQIREANYNHERPLKGERLACQERIGMAASEEHTGTANRTNYMRERGR